MLIDVNTAYGIIYNAGYDFDRSETKPNLTVSKEVADLLVGNDYPQYSWTNGTNFSIVGSDLVVSQYYMVDDYDTGELVSEGLDWEITIPILFYN